MIEKLAPFKKIAWDFDGVLCEHPNSPLFHRFIMEHPEIQHDIVTFRSHGWETVIFDRLKEFYSHPPDRRHFNVVYNIGDKLWEAFDNCKLRRLAGLIQGPLTIKEAEYLEYKGLVCHTHGLPVLIDDKTEEVTLGCDKYGIAYFHPDDLG